MWPFSKREPKEPTGWELQIMELEAWRPVGTTFQHLGVEFVVTGHSHYSFDVHGPCDWEWPELTAQYRDNLGIVRELKFDMDQAKTLMEAQP